jgi:SnoaL-like domain
VQRETGSVPNVAEVADRLAIYDVLVAHCRGVDRADAGILRSTYWPDAEVAYGVFNGNAHRFCAFLPKAIAVYARTQHCIGNVAMEFEGKTARVETYVTAYHYAEATEGDRELIYFARYLDRMEKRGSVWKILYRQVVIDWYRNAPASAVGSTMPLDGFAHGARAPDDPLYAHLRR